MMESRRSCFTKWSLVSVAILALTDSVFIPLVVYRICYQSTSSFVPSQCVNCPFLALQGYSFSCFGNTAFPRNMTPAQAQCMIQKCQDGVRQTPVYLGRKKRETADEADLSEGKTRELEAEMQVAGQINILVDTEFDYDEMF
ncbi:hypothetical protein JTE90_021943 [Oedothorax gibbosus]|uniref:Uncharacterized protein n=1 Tax=Oedothorax gibbosus TaxID=931172 RepID=A0AAV6V6A9_9ARAC|nr:hypothetical protein JTE90_021943 [Oedothorax gibbosus]